MKDVMGALRNWLAAQPEIAALVADRLFVNRLPREAIEAEDTFHPRKMLVLRQVGGLGKADLMVTDQPTVEARCYGETDFEADSVRRAVWERCVKLERVDQDTVLVYDINPVGGPFTLFDPDIVWPAVSQNFSVHAAVL